MSSFSCNVIIKICNTKSPVELGEVYFQSWVAGVEGGGSWY